MSDEKTSKLYMHKDHAEMVAFVAKVRSKAIQHKDDLNVGRLVRGQTITGSDANAIIAARASANEMLHCLMIDLIGCQTLIGVVSTDYKDRGLEALDYIQKCFAAGDDGDKLNIAYEDYVKLSNKKYTAEGLTEEEFKKDRIKMASLKTQLHGSDYQQTDAMFALHLQHMITRIDDVYRADLRRKIDTMSETDRKIPAKVATAIEGVIALRVRRDKPEAEETKSAADAESKESNDLKLMRMLLDRGSSPDEVARIMRLGSR